MSLKSRVLESLESVRNKKNSSDITYLINFINTYQEEDMTDIGSALRGEIIYFLSDVDLKEELR